MMRCRYILRKEEAHHREWRRRRRGCRLMQVRVLHMRKKHETPRGRQWIAQAMDPSKIQVQPGMIYQPSRP